MSEGLLVQDLSRHDAPSGLRLRGAHDRCAGLGRGRAGRATAAGTPRLAAQVGQCHARTAVGTRWGHALTSVRGAWLPYAVLVSSSGSHSPQQFAEPSFASHTRSCPTRGAYPALSSSRVAHRTRTITDLASRKTPQAPGLPRAPVEELVVTFRLFHLPSGRARALFPVFG